MNFLIEIIIVQKISILSFFIFIYIFLIKSSLTVIIFAGTGKKKGGHYNFDLSTYLNN